MVVDTSLTRARSLADSIGCAASAELDGIRSADAVVVAASTEAHVAIAEAAIGFGLPLLIEKPLATSIADVEAIVALARQSGIPLMCGFVERFNPAIATLRELIDAPFVHALAIRHSPPDLRAKPDVAHDLLIHDIDLILRLAGSDPTSVFATQAAFSPDAPPDVADCLLRFNAGAVAALSASRASHRKLRSIEITTASALFEVDLLRADITVYRHVRHEIAEGGTYRAETVVDIPFVRHHGEPLALEFDHFMSLAAGEGDAAAELISILPPHRVATIVATS